MTNNKNLILRLSNEIGNQMFMYAAAFSISKKMNRNLLIDNETAYLSRKNISSYGLNNFDITAKISNNDYKFKNLKGYLERKFLKKTDFLRTFKKFYVEKKNKDKVTKFDIDFIKKNFSDNLFLEGHFESEKYFASYKEELLKEFNFKDKNRFNELSIYNQINQPNTVGICLRQNRFNEGRGKLNIENINKSKNFVDEQISYINKSVKFLYSKSNNFNFFIWSNNKLKENDERFDFKYKFIDLDKYKQIFDLRILSLYLLKHCQHHIVTPSSFNWWGAWLSMNSNKIITRPNESFFSEFKLNNLDFWPKNWIKINE